VTPNNNPVTYHGAEVGEMQRTGRGSAHLIKLLGNGKMNRRIVMQNVLGN
jgi:hypothetical protein